MGPLRNHDRRLLTLCVAIAALWISLPPAPAAAMQVGAAADLTWGISPAEVDRTVAVLRRAGVRTIRLNMSWTGTEPAARGVLNPGHVRHMDYAVRTASDAGLDLLLQVGDGVPYWASADPARHADESGQHWNDQYRPRDVRDFAAFARFIAERYGNRVRAYEVWNEPNHPYFWPSGPDAAEYAQMLSAGATAIRSADPGATIVLGGLSANDHEYLEELYEAGAADSFDVAAVHPYTGSVAPGRCWRDENGALAKDAFCGIDQIRATMRANGDARTPVWVTEFGWSSYRGRWGVTEAEQARFLEDAVRRLAARPWVRRAYWYALRDAWFLEGPRADFQAHFGVLRADFSRKPAYASLRRMAKRHSSTRVSGRRRGAPQR